jgi:hypothetical protein
MCRSLHEQIPKMYIILFITHHRYHSLTHLKTTAIEIQDIKIIKKNEVKRKEHSVSQREDRKFACYTINQNGE